MVYREYALWPLPLLGRNWQSNTGVNRLYGQLLRAQSFSRLKRMGGNGLRLAQNDSFIKINLVHKVHFHVTETVSQLVFWAWKGRKKWKIQIEQRWNYLKNHYGPILWESSQDGPALSEHIFWGLMCSTECISWSTITLGCFERDTRCLKRSHKFSYINPRNPVKLMLLRWYINPYPGQNLPPPSTFCTAAP